FNRRTVRDCFENGLNDILTGSAACTGARCLTYGFESPAAGTHRFHNPAFRHAIAVAHLKRIRGIRKARLVRLCGKWKEEFGAILRPRRFPVEDLDEPRPCESISEKDGSGEPSFSHDHLFVDSLARVRISDDFVFVVEWLLASHDHELNAHDLEFR